MAKSTRAGELRTSIRVVTQRKSKDADGYMSGDEKEAWTGCCKWVNAYGREVYDARQAGVEEPATLTLRYTGRIGLTSLVYREKDPRPYRVISVNDVENRHRWLEVKVERKVAAQ